MLTKVIFYFSKDDLILMPIVGLKELFIPTLCNEKTIHNNTTHN